MKCLVLLSAVAHRAGEAHAFTTWADPDLCLDEARDLAAVAGPKSVVCLRTMDNVLWFSDHEYARRTQAILSRGAP